MMMMISLVRVEVSPRSVRFPVICERISVIVRRMMDTNHVVRQHESGKVFHPIEGID